MGYKYLSVCTHIIYDQHTVKGIMFIEGWDVPELRIATVLQTYILSK